MTAAVRMRLQQQVPAVELGLQVLQAAEVGGCLGSRRAVADGAAAL
jgi:hypothetical protein